MRNLMRMMSVLAVWAMAGQAFAGTAAVAVPHSKFIRNRNAVAHPHGAKISHQKKNYKYKHDEEGSAIKQHPVMK